MAGFVREDMGAASSRLCSIEGRLGTDTLFSLQTNAALLWEHFKTVVFPLMLSSSRVSEIEQCMP